MLSDRELATVLAALDNWASEDYYYEEGAELPVNAARFTEHEPLTLDEINALRKKLAHQDRPLVTIEVRGGVAEYEASDGVDVVLIDHDDEEEG